MKEQILAMIRQVKDDHGLGVFAAVAANLADQEKYEDCLTYLLGGMDLAYQFDNDLGPALHGLRTYIKNLMRAR